MSERTLEGGASRVRENIFRRLPCGSECGCLKSAIEPSFNFYGVMDSSRDFDLLGESVPQVRVSARTLALSGFFICNIF